MIHGNPMRIINGWLDRRNRAAASNAARTLGQIGRDIKTRRAAMTDELRREVRECEIKPLGWRA